MQIPQNFNNNDLDSNTPPSYDYVQRNPAINVRYPSLSEHSAGFVNPIADYRDNLLVNPLDCVLDNPLRGDYLGNDREGSGGTNNFGGNLVGRSRNNSPGDNPTSGRNSGGNNLGGICAGVNCLSNNTNGANCIPRPKNIFGGNRDNPLNGTRNNPLPPGYPTAPTPDTPIFDPRRSAPTQPLTGGSFINRINYNLEHLNQRVGVYISYIEKSVIVCCIENNSPFISTDLRVGDCILEINNKKVSNLSPRKIRDLILSKSNGYIVVSSRPFHRVVTLAKDQNGKVGLTIKNSVIVSLHNKSDILRSKLVGKVIVEVNGNSTIGMNDAQLERICLSTLDRISLTVVPFQVYQKLMLLNVMKNF